MTVPERVYELWRQYGWLVDDGEDWAGKRYTYSESWCHGFEGPAPEAEPEIKVEKGEER